jgi:hypothetical protein
MCLPFKRVLLSCCSNPDGICRRIRASKHWVEARGFCEIKGNMRTQGGNELQQEDPPNPTSSSPAAPHRSPSISISRTHFSSSAMSVSSPHPAFARPKCTRGKEGARESEERGREGGRAGGREGGREGERKKAANYRPASHAIASLPRRTKLQVMREIELCPFLF